jgi:hypothetical protein
MAPPELPKAMARITRLPRHKIADAISKLSKEEIRMFHKHMASIKIPSEKLALEQAGTLPFHWDEHIQDMCNQETIVDSFMKRIAGTIPSTALLEIEECSRQAKQLASEIFESWEVLHTMLAHHEEIIRKRWAKKTRAQKRDILLIAWPGMSTSHRPDMDENVFLNVATQDITNPRRGSESTAWPYINLEDLVEPNALPVFMDARGRNLPDKFAHADLELAPVYKLRKEFLAIRRDNCTMMFLGQRCAETYGEIIEWDSASATLDSIKKGHATHPDQGLRILTIQQGIWTFLHRCTALILADDLHQIKLLVSQPWPRT